MTTARTQQVHIPSTPFYHCTVRCVRRAFLFGNDPLTGNNYDHRKQWIVSRMRFLSYIYAIDICAYSVMCNHYHLVLHVDTARSLSWSDREVAERWMQLFNGNILVTRWLKGETNTEAESEKAKEIIAQWRERLSSISWFMRCMNERIAAMANTEDKVTGRFWEGRFKSQALLDEAALLTCMAYVDLNPVRAQMADALEHSDFTSIQQRLHDTLPKLGDTTPPQNQETHAQEIIKDRVKKQQATTKALGFDTLPVAPLMPFDGSVNTPISVALPFTKEEYFTLVESTGKIIRTDKRGCIANDATPILRRMGIDETQWASQIQQYGSVYGSCVGGEERMRQYAKDTGQSWFQGVSTAKILFRRQNSA